MKNIFLLLILISNLIYSQQIYPLYTEGKIDLPSGSYFKDLNNELNPYVGLWKGNWNGKIVYLEFRKIKYLSGKLSDVHYIYYDRIVGERKIINSNGAVEIDKISTFDNNPYHEYDGINFKFSNPSQKQIYFVTGICGKTANLDVTFLDNAQTQMSLHLIYNPSTIDDTCPYYNSVIQGNDFPINFPKDIVLTKQ
ncbi:hypothetical protein SAMN05444360_12034 [Chryseobacterium carnipullorum]|uniref:DUF6705 family protein n=1 Tax=Chryseobacterium carnipullorum TaxID=1124835 RepID=UPI00090F6B5B|nr:DUF6705 family protein [Chryseobacterium carnipullorum]SHM87712.1 hypothetical protein SAMN05444360_12034 [Chryseobacterium carnipullorum]